MRFLLSAFLLIGSLSACNGEERLNWNQRMTVTVETPDGPVTGSTVYEVGARIFPGGQAITGSVAQYGFRGEAAVVDLGEGRYVFALAHPFGEYIYRTAPEVFSQFDSEDRVAWLTHFQTLGAPITVREEFYPRFVTFGDIEDPLTADIFEASEAAEALGEGYAIRSVTLEVVEAPLSIGTVDEVLVWRCDFVDPYRRLDGNTGAIFGNSAPEILGPGEFVAEMDVCQ